MQERERESARLAAVRALRTPVCIAEGGARQNGTLTPRQAARRSERLSTSCRRAN
eukprot:CAMPEP_0174717246 /NCGR_PEP_ID=MMETSP1094-20130205/26327_1 /TAXON_ID=156173 /ORGANISM="Chrysochromulina brevifilum, Strain UTEX LB 985" /LENGTH=54 /DNA_ID=CAMNT_0015917159 /DNA_START=103 /DNA_END=264 /DNA_ORIENTATION=-